MKYRNKVTGAIIDIPGVISGDVWEKVEAAPKRESKPAPEKVAPKKAPTETKKPEIKAPKRGKKK